MAEPDPSAPKPQSVVSQICVVAGAVIGLTVGKVAAASLAPQPAGGGFNVIELALAGIFGGVGAVLGGCVACVIGRFRR